MSGAPGKVGGAGKAGGTLALAARVRASKHLSRTLKRYWLTVLPHLEPADQARLDAILRGEIAATEPPPAPSAPPATSTETPAGEAEQAPGT